MSKYSKNLAGQALKVFVSPAVAYTTDATLALFIDNAVEGELGVYLSDGTLKTSVLNAGEEFIIVQKRDGGLNKTPILKYNEVFDIRLAEYDAPVKQITSIGYNGTSGDLFPSFAAASATNTLTFGISARETTPGNQPFPVQEGYATVNSSTADEYTVLASIVSQLNGDFDYERTQPDKFVKAEILSNGALTELTEDATVVNGSTIVTFAGNQTLATGSFLSFRGAIYKVAVGVTAGTSLTLDRPYQGVSETIDVSATVDLAAAAAYTSGTTALGVRLTSIEFESHFKVVGNPGLEAAPVTALTAWKLGIGSGASIVALEKEGLFFDGLGSTPNAAFKEDYGQPTLFASASGEYDLFFIDAAPKVLPSALPTQFEQKQIQRVVIAAPQSGTSPTADLEAILGL